VSGEHPYACALYALALADMGSRVDVPEWETFVLSRTIPGKDSRDLSGAYPLAALSPDADIEGGLDRLKASGFVSLVLVPDPLRGPARQTLSDTFDLCRPFKTHQLVDTTRSYEPSKHHRDRIRRGMRRCDVRVVRLADHLACWTALYAGLAEKREIRGAAAFSDGYFQALARDERMTAFAAFVDEALVAMTIWFAHDGAVYNHLTASNALGYANGANFALYDTAITHFRGRGTINLGGGAGFADDPDDGLAAFKRGFANTTVEALLCGAILDPSRYSSLSAARESSGFFPAYRG
jgi:hypothetical protein